MRTETFNSLIFIVFIAVLIGIPFSAGVLSSESFAAVLKAGFQNILGVSGIIISLTTLFFVLHQIRIARNDNALLNLSFIYDVLEFLYRQQDIAKQTHQLIADIKVYNEYFEGTARSPFVQDIKLREGKKQIVMDKGADLQKKLDRDQAIARKYLKANALEILVRLTSNCELVLEHKRYFWGAKKPNPFGDHLDSYEQDIADYKELILKQIVWWEAQKQSVLIQSMPAVSV